MDGNGDLHIEGREDGEGPAGMVCACSDLYMFADWPLSLRTLVFSDHPRAEVWLAPDRSQFDVSVATQALLECRRGRRITQLQAASSQVAGDIQRNVQGWSHGLTFRGLGQAVQSITCPLRYTSRSVLGCVRLHVCRVLSALASACLSVIA